jgi:carbamoyl-phosphate synthase small subunit
VRDERTKRVEITSQNHGFGVELGSLLATGAEVTHTHLNDDTVSGFWHWEKRVFAVQYHPESNPGPARQPAPVPGVPAVRAMEGRS